MRVLYVIDSLRAGGAEQSLAMMCAPLAHRGVELTVATFTSGGEFSDAVAASPATLLEHDVTGLRARVALLRDVIGRHDPDLVHTTLYDADLAGRIAARRSGVPVSSTLTTTRYVDGWAPEVPRWKTAMVQVGEAASSRACRRLHAVSEYVADSMARSLRYPRHRIDVAPRGRDDAALGRRTPQRREQVRSGLEVGSEPVLLAIGRHDTVKGIDRVVDALPAVLQAHPDAVLLVAGREGDATADLHRRCDELAVAGRVRFLGHRTDVADLLAAADVFVSGSRREGLPGTVVEAMALETPIVATALPQIVEVADGAARLIGRDDSLSDGVLAALSTEHAETTRSLTRTGRERFTSHYTLDAAVDGLVGHWGRVLAHPKGST